MYRKLYLNKSNSNPPTAAYILPVQLIENLYKAGVETFHEQPIAHICVPLTGKLLLYILLGFLLMINLQIRQFGKHLEFPSFLCVLSKTKLCANEP